jgi:hypothetical protein
MSGTSSTPGNALRSTYGQHAQKQPLISAPTQSYVTATTRPNTPHIRRVGQRPGYYCPWTGQQQVKQYPQAYLLRSGVTFALQYNLMASLRPHRWRSDTTYRKLLVIYDDDL